MCCKELKFLSKVKKGAFPFFVLSLFILHFINNKLRNNKRSSVRAVCRLLDLSCVTKHSNFEAVCLNRVV